MQRTAECTNAARRTEMQTSLCKDLENKIARLTGKLN